MLWLSESGRCILGRTNFFAFWTESPPLKLGSPFLCCCNIRCWPFVDPISVAQSGLDRSTVDIRKSMNSVSMEWNEWMNEYDLLFVALIYFSSFGVLQSASGIIFPIIKAEGVRQMFFPATVPAYYRTPPSKQEWTWAKHISCLQVKMRLFAILPGGFSQHFAFIADILMCIYNLLPLKYYFRFCPPSISQYLNCLLCLFRT